MSTASESRGGDAPTRAVVVDDSRFMRTLIRKLLEDGGVEVVGEAEDGSVALDAVIEHDPDVVTMDIEMPSMNGIEAVERIMADHPTPVLMLSAHAEADADVTFEALDRGAVDFVKKPGGEVTSSMPKVRHELVEKVESAAKVDLSASARASASASTATTSRTASTETSRSTASTTSPSPSGSASRSPTRDSAAKPSSGDTRTGARSGAMRQPDAAGASGRTYADVGTLLVGASTGGPKIVEQLIAGLPRDANLRILVVQHMPEGFTSRFATRLDERSEYDFGEAESGERIGPGEGRVAPGGRHLLVTGDRGDRLRLELTETEQIHGVRPAIDLTMASAAESAAQPLCAVLLTGMGRDGVDGMQRIARAGGHTIAQDEATSAIFGMPRRAIETGCVDAVESAGDVAETALRYFTEEE
ncbi:chemotaxis-specific protein-glutamate methyltransferase CheB [Halobellus sp. GM3]|uniref:chemotaxis-specific protein-glutamate methyltransferase CheB n=1 Tax=Halobellus sp. GM3 TaxID=3458410 RepID=UPI00403DD71B